MKFAVETKGNDVYIDGVKQEFDKRYPLTIEDKILISITSKIGYEPANCLVLDNIWEY